MSYLGQVELKSSEIRRIDVGPGNTSATHTLTWTPASEQSLIITINGVKQQNNYSFSGTTLTLDTALVATDEMEVIGILDIGEAVVPPDDSITTAMVKDDAVTADKLANSINTEIAANTAKTGITSGQASAITANTAKVTNATHTGDVTGATALTIASGAVDLAMLSATGTASSSTFLRGDNAWEAAGGDNTPSFAAHRTTSQAIANDTATKVQCDVVLWDTDSAYDNTTNFRFTVPVGGAGKYCITWMASMVYIDDGNGTWALIYKNGSSVGQGPYIFYGANTNQGPSLSSTWILDLADSDYLELYIWHNEGSTENLLDNKAFFSAYKLIGV